ncbi:uncharacterized protein LOC121694223 isoform X2 [Alosa sapidissima]|uniref:uncharacterized protein LOC121694223 isoform X2 n=1 Tax=Alosa sapidissima TaxID=34773 RepID=UPI001C09E243|nr:uncharacterized protein LOC121694223 isoform X2 [Alosa sapidissima]
MYGARWNMWSLVELLSVAETPARKFAVVQWSEGDDKGKLSDVKTDAIIRYDDTKMGPDGLPLSLYLASVEWRRGKRPQGGYPHYAANVKFVTGSRYEATRKLNELTKSNKPAPQTKRISVPPKKYGEESDDTDTEVPQQTDKRLKVSQTDPAKEFLKMYGGIPQTSSDEINNLKKSVSALTQKNIDLEKECQKWKDLVLQDVPGLIFGMKKIICQPASPRTPGSEDCPSQCLPYFTQPTSSPSSTVSTQSSSPSASSQSSKMAIDAGSGDMDTTSSSPSKVEIFKGSGVMVDKLAWVSQLMQIHVQHL